MTLSSHQKISPRSRSSKIQYVACQNGYRPLPQWVTQFRMEWPCEYRWDDHCYFANQVWPQLAVWVSKSCISTGNVFWIWNLFRRGQPLAGRSAPTAKRLADHVDVVYRDVIAGSRESRGNHYDAPFIYRILKSLLSQNNTYFIATASVVKDAVDTPNCQGLREQWYYLRFYHRRCDSTCAARCRLL